MAGGDNAIGDNVIFSDVGDFLGKFGLWHFMYFSSLLYVFGVTAFSLMSVLFLAPTLNFTCINEVPGQVTLDQCYYRANESETLYECTQWKFDKSFYQRTFTEEYSLVCTRTFLVSVANSLQHVGDAVGSLFLGHLADLFGRRPIILFAAFCGIVASLLSQFAPTFAFILIGKVLYGASSMGMISAGYVLLMEITEVQKRGAVGVGIQIGWVSFYIALPGISWLLRNSNYLQWVLTMSNCFLPVLIFTVPESPRWLLLKGKQKQAAKVIESALKRNGKTIKELEKIVNELSSKMKKTEEQKNSNSILDLFRTPSLRRRTFILYFYWFVNGFVYYGISQNAGIFGSTYYLNFFLFGVVEIPAFIVLYFVLQRWKRKWPLGLLMASAGVFCMLVGIVPNNMHWVMVTLIVLGKFCIACSFVMSYTYTTEAFPTAVRGIGLGSCSMFSRIAAVLAPFATEIDHVIGLQGVMAIFGCLGLIAGALVYWLPETKGTILLDTLKQAEGLGEIVTNDDTDST